MVQVPLRNDIAVPPVLGQHATVAPEAPQAVLDRVTDLVFAVDPALQLTYVNAAAATRFRTAADAVYGQPLSTVIPETSELLQHCRQALATQHPAEVTTGCDRDQVWWRARLFPAADGLTVYLTDVTRARQALEAQPPPVPIQDIPPAQLPITTADALRLANRRLGILTETASQLLASREPQQVVNQLCREVSAVIGADVFFNFLVHEESQRLRLNACGGIPQETADRITWLEYGTAVCGCVARDGARIIANDIRHTPDARTELVKSFGVQSYVCHPLLSQGKVIGTLSFGTRARPAFADEDIELMRSVADLVAIGMERKRTEDALRESEERFRLLTTNSPDSIFCQDEHLVYTWFHNPMFPLERDEIIGKTDAELFPPEEATRLMTRKRQVMETGVAVRDELNLTVAGEPHTFDAVYQPWRDAEGRITGVAGYARDVTALKEAERAKDEFLAVLSHELHTPLTCVLGWAQVALDSPTPEMLQQSLEVVYRNALRQKRLVDEILDMSRLIHRKVRLALESLDLREQAAQAVENIRVDAAEHQLTVRLQLPPEPLEITADPVRIQQCLGNLLHNSLKFTPAGGTITVTCRREGADALFTVQDTGRGLDSKGLASLFAIFRQIERDERAGGLGLGLAITRALVELHHGHLTADSPGKGQGSTFTIALPLSSLPS